MTRLSNGLERHKLVALEYLKTFSPEKTAKTMNMSVRQIHRILKKPDIQAFVQEELDKIKNEKIADGKEVMEFLTSVMRGELKEEEIVTLGVGEGFSEAVKIQKEIYQKDRIKAADLLGKAYGIYTQNLDINSNVQVVFENEKDLED